MDREDNRQRAEALVTQNRALLLGHARNICRNTADADDLVQETLMRFMTYFQHRPLPVERACSVWLTNTLTHLFYDQCRRRQVRNRATQDPHLRNEVVEAQELASPLASEAVTPELFSQAMQQLSPAHRETVELFSRGKSYKESAALLGVKIGTIAKRLHDARASLREYLSQHLHLGEH